MHRGERAFPPSNPRNLITRVLTICHEKHTQSTHCVGAKAFELRSLSPALCNLFLLLVYLWGIEVSYWLRPRAVSRLRARRD